MTLYPQQLGRLFVQTGESYKESLFDSAVRKFGHDRAFGLLDECMALDDVPMFMLAASRDVGDDGVGGAPLFVIYHLVRRNLHGLFVAYLFALERDHYGSYLYDWWKLSSSIIAKYPISCCM